MVELSGTPRWRQLHLYSCLKRRKLPTPSLLALQSGRPNTRSSDRIYLHPLKAKESREGETVFNSSDLFSFSVSHFCLLITCNIDVSCRLTCDASAAIMVVYIVCTRCQCLHFFCVDHCWNGHSRLHRWAAVSCQGERYWTVFSWVRQTPRSSH